MMAVSAVVMMVQGGRIGRRNSEIDEDRKEYLRHLADKRNTVVLSAAAQARSLTWRHPDPSDLWAVAGTPGMWRQAPGDSDFCTVRFGRGSRPAAGRR